MTNALYGKGREGFAGAAIDWVNDDVRIIFVDAADYTLAIDTHDFLDDVPAGARVATSSALASKTNTLGVCDAADKTLTGVTGDPFELIIGYKHTGTESTSRLIFALDTATNLPLTPNGGDVTVAWDNGANKIFKL
jgi:hypothetical protein